MNALTYRDRLNRWALGVVESDSSSVAMVELWIELPHLMRRHGVALTLRYIDKKFPYEDENSPGAIGLLLSSSSGQWNREVFSREDVSRRNVCMQLESLETRQYLQVAIELLERAEALCLTIKACGTKSSTGEAKGNDNPGALDASLPRCVDVPLSTSVAWVLHHFHWPSYMSSEYRANFYQLVEQNGVPSEMQKKAICSYTVDMTAAGFAFHETALLDRAFLNAGNASVWDSWLEIDPILGVPRINAEGVKGACRREAVALMEANMGITQDWINAAFGDENGEGSAYVEFADALWQCSPNGAPFVADVLTPHETAYHESQGAKSDYNTDSPSPSALLAAIGTFAFPFRLCDEARRQLDDGGKAAALATIGSLLRHTLHARGLGAHTNMGQIGRFSS